MATYCAAHYPKQCVGLMTESAQAFVEDRTLAGIREAEVSFQEPNQLNRLARYHGDKAYWVLEAWIKTWLSPEFADWSLAKVLPFVQCPTLVLHGEQDEYGSVAHPQMIAELIDAPTELEIMAGVKHIPHREQEQWVVERVSRFVKGL
jgi:pimeloyl-ACP methyl ester carboxylesterase